MSRKADVVVVGAGVNGLAAAAMLAKAGFDVVVLERADEPGGAVRTAEVTVPGFRHDLYAANLNLFVGGAFFAEHGAELAEHGFEVVGAEKPFGSMYERGRFVGVTTSGPHGLSAHDAESFKELAERFDAVSKVLFPLLAVPLPSREAFGAVWKARRRWQELARLALHSSRALVEEHFEEDEARALVASWGMHLDFPPDFPGGALFAFLETFASARFGMALGKGGARTLTDSLVAMLRTHGGELVTSAEVVRIEKRRVRTADGERHDAARAVIANLTPGPLSKLVELPPAWHRYRYAPGTMMIHLALDDLPRWLIPEARAYSYVHVAHSLDEMSRTYADAVAGRLPQRPTLVVGQPTAIDPSRAPEGKHVLWVQVRMLPSGWDGDKEAYADSMLEQLEQLAPGLRAQVLGRHVLSPADLERANPNLVGGDQLGGSHHPAQNFLLRPVPKFSRYKTPVEGLWICGAATWPGAGVGAGSGYLVGKELTRGKLPRGPAKRRGAR